MLSTKSISIKKAQKQHFHLILAVGQVDDGHGAPAPMEVGKGAEFRIFDQFDDHYIKNLYDLYH